jgi:hypothetical protein
LVAFFDSWAFKLVAVSTLVKAQGLSNPGSGFRHQARVQPQFRFPHAGFDFQSSAARHNVLKTEQNTSIQLGSKSATLEF